MNSLVPQTESRLRFPAPLEADVEAARRFAEAARAGVNATERVVTNDGFALNWAVNYFGPVLLTRLLLERIEASPPPRIINVTTITDFIGRVDLDAIEATPDFATSEPYTESKLALNMYTIDLAQRLEGSGVTANLLYPGYIRSNLLRNLSGAARVMQFVMRIMASSTEVGADRAVRLAASSKYEGINGAYVVEDSVRAPHSEAPIAAKQEHLMRLTDDTLSQWV